jgi:PAS domain S-box-containing protein
MRSPEQATALETVAGLKSMLRSDEERFRQMIDALPAAVYTTDADGRITHFNRACVDFSGRTPTLGTDQWCVSWKLFHPDGRPMPHQECPMAVALKERRIIQDAEAIAERPDGSRIWFMPYPTLLLDEAAKVIGGINMLVDITQRKQDEEKLRRSEEALRRQTSQFTTLVEHIPDIVARLDRDLRFLYISPMVEQITGKPAEHYIGMPRKNNGLAPEFAAQREALSRKVFETGQEYTLEFPMQTPAGERFMECRCIPEFAADGSVESLMTLTRDITERKLQERALRESEERFRMLAEQAEQANRAKDKFLAVLSHELRTPLTPVMMSITAMDMDPDLPPTVRESVAMIRRNVELETKLIDDLLDLSRVTTGKLRLNIETVDVNQAVRHVCQTCRPSILEKGIHLHCGLPDAAQYVRADNARLQQVLWNLIKNSAKFTPEHGDIHVAVSAAPEQRVRIEVRDSGIGMSADVLPRIFDAFEQGDATITRQFGGMGLGLAISKALVEMHGGSITATSEGEQRGSTFIVELPAVVPETQPARADGKTAAGNGSIRILVVEDHADTATVLARLLARCGHTVTTVSNAAAALELAAKEKFDVLVSDIGLPDATGYDLMRQIAARFPIKGIAMSGYGMDEDLRKSREAGFSDHIVKPVNLAQLEQAIHRAAEAKRAR